MNKLIIDNFSVSVNSYYKHKLTILNKKYSARTFSEVKKLFKPKLSVDIDLVKINREEGNLLSCVGINALTTECDNKKLIIREH